jgi:small GTP-binding protein
MDNEDIIYKLVLVGEGGVGKTSLIKQFVYSKYDDKYIKTLGTNIYSKEISLGEGPQLKYIHLQIWDVLGQNTFQAIIKSALRNAQGIIFVCDLTRLDSFKKLNVWIDYAYRFCERASFIFMANKADLPNRQFDEKEIKTYANKFKSPFFLTSAKTGENVEFSFKLIAQKIYNKEFAPPKETIKLEPSKVEIKPAIKVEDNIINLFCIEAGGFEVTMPIIRKQFQKLNIDFENPSKEDLEKVIAKLIDYIRFIKDETTAKELAIKLRRNLYEKGLT